MASKQTEAVGSMPTASTESFLGRMAQEATLLAALAASDEEDDAQALAIANAWAAQVGRRIRATRPLPARMLGFLTEGHGSYAVAALVAVALGYGGYKGVKALTGPDLPTE